MPENRPADRGEPPEHRREQRPVSTLQALGWAASVGINLAANIVVGVYLGRYLDAWLGTSPVFKLLGTALGLASGLWSTYKMMGIFYKR